MNKIYKSKVVPLRYKSVKGLENIDKIIEIQPQIGQKVKAEIDNLRCKLIINQSRTQADIDIGFSMKLICKKYFGIN